MNTPYSTLYTPAAPVLEIRLAAPGESPQVGPLPAIVDTGSDGTLIPTDYLEQVEAIGLGEAILRSVLSEARRVHLYEVDVYVAHFVFPGVIVAGAEHSDEIILGRNVLNKLVLLLDGLRQETELLERRTGGH